MDYEDNENKRIDKIFVISSGKINDDAREYFRALNPNRTLGLIDGNQLSTPKKAEGRKQGMKSINWVHIPCPYYHNHGLLLMHILLSRSPRLDQGFPHFLVNKSTTLD